MSASFQIRKNHFKNCRKSIFNYMYHAPEYKALQGRD